ncbi:hypothetical protein Bbelb_191610 [Branchiostoma belcheri]|nr:hypothetical protein Bbelb_191610 [Branchiostoma belcheri]
MEKVIDFEGGETDDRQFRVGRGALRRHAARWQFESIAGYGKLRLYLTMFLCVLWDLSVFLSILGGSVFLSKFMEDLSGILCACPVFQEDLPVCVPEGPVTYLRDKRTSDLDQLFQKWGLHAAMALSLHE